MEESEKIANMEVSIDNSGEKESMGSDNCHIYVVAMRSENLQSQDEEKTDVEKNGDDKVTISILDTF